MTVSGLVSRGWTRPFGRDFARWLSDVPCCEQVLWLTHSSSGWFMKGWRGRTIVITATAADDESNETEFPYALATVAEQSRETLDEDQDGNVSIAELFTATTKEVQKRFKGDKRLRPSMLRSTTTATVAAPRSRSQKGR